MQFFRKLLIGKDFLDDHLVQLLTVVEIASICDPV